jgi:hypothetical protein
VAKPWRDNRRQRWIQRQASLVRRGSCDRCVDRDCICGWLVWRHTTSGAATVGPDSTPIVPVIADALMVSLGMSFAQQSLEAAVAEALVIYRQAFVPPKISKPSCREHYGQRAASIQMNLA